MSMTKEEAIEALQKFVNGYEKNIYGEAVRQNGFVQAIKVVISALRPITREQVEKVWRGEWLNFYNDFSTAECSRCGELFEVSPGETPQEDYFNAFKEFYHFCPSCGAPMTDEAVDMVMERLEALKDET